MCVACNGQGCPVCWSESPMYECEECHYLMSEFQEKIEFDGLYFCCDDCLEDYLSYNGFIDYEAGETFFEKVKELKIVLS